jgi:hypothetical protein
MALLALAALACGLENIQIVESPNGAATATVTAQPGAAQQVAQAGTPAGSNPNQAPAGSPTVTVSVETNCRSGPGLIYANVYSLPVGTTAVVIGKNTITNYWIIQIPGSGGTCWLWGQYATVTGNTAALTEYATPTAGVTPNTPVPTVAATTQAAGPVNPPSNFQSVVQCVAGIDGQSTVYTGTVSWSDNSSNETGFHIVFIQGFGYAEEGNVGPNATSYNFNLTIPDSNVGPKVGFVWAVAPSNAGPDAPPAFNNASCP